MANPHHKVFLEITIANKNIGWIEMELFTNVVPDTAEKFRALCTGEMGDDKSSKPLHYKRSYFYRVIPQFMCQIGNFIGKNNTRNKSIYNNRFPTENYQKKHTGFGDISMVISTVNYADHNSSFARRRPTDLTINTLCSVRTSKATMSSGILRKLEPNGQAQVAGEDYRLQSMLDRDVFELLLA